MFNFAFFLYKFFLGLLFNFTITIPFEREAQFNEIVLSAEEIAKWIQEQVNQFFYILCKFLYQRKVA